jgi:hypothetical protein
MMSVIASDNSATLLCRTDDGTPVGWRDRLAGWRSTPGPQQACLWCTATGNGNALGRNRARRAAQDTVNAALRVRLQS